MRKVTIKHNPYLVNTLIEIDGLKPRPSSSLNIETKRLQEWITRLPKILVEEYYDNNFDISFTGTQVDYKDVVSAFESYGNGVCANFEWTRTPDIGEVEARIQEIFEEIKKGPFPELKEPAITDAIGGANNSQFDIQTRNAKMREVVLAFQNALNELTIIARLEKSIADDKTNFGQLEKQIKQIEIAIDSAKLAQTFSKELDTSEIETKAKKETESYFEIIRAQIRRMIADKTVEESRENAKKQAAEMQKTCKYINEQMKVKIDKITSLYEESAKKIVEQCKKCFEKSDIVLDTKGSPFNPAEIHLGDFSGILAKNTTSVDKGQYITERKDRDIGTCVAIGACIGLLIPFCRLGGGLLGGLLGWNFAVNHPKTNQKWVAMHFDYVNMQKTAEQYLNPILEDTNIIQNKLMNYVTEETNRLTKDLRTELEKIDNFLEVKSKELEQVEANKQKLIDELKAKENNLKWLLDVQKRIKDIIEF